MTVKELKELIAKLDPALDDKKVWYVDFGGYDQELNVAVDPVQGVAITGA